MERYDSREKRAMKNALHEYKYNTGEAIHVTEHMYIRKGKRRGRRLNINYYLAPTTKVVAIPEKVQTFDTYSQIAHDVGRFLTKRGVRLVI